MMVNLMMLSRIFGSALRKLTFKKKIQVPNRNNQHLWPVCLTLAHLLLVCVQTIMIPGPKLRPEDEPDAVKIEIPKPAAVQWYK